MQYSDVYLFSKLDLVLFPLYLAFFFYLLRNKIYRYSVENNFKSILILAIIAKVAFTIFHPFLIEFVYNGEGDMKGYFIGLKELNAYLDINHISLLNFYSNIEYHFPNVGFTHLSSYNYTASTVRLVQYLLPIYKLMMGNFLCISLFCSVWAFWGAVQILKVLVEFFGKYKKLAAICVLLSPTTSFWSAGLFKESIAFGSTGFLFFGLYQIVFKKKYSVVSIFTVLINTLLIYNIKPYILIIYVGVFIWYILHKVSIQKSQFRKYSIVIFTLIFSLMVLNFATTFTTESEDSNINKYSVDSITELLNSTKEGYGGSVYSLGEFDLNNPLSFYKAVPIAIVTCFFRPFIWENKNALMLINSLESLALLCVFLLGLFKHNLFGYFRKIFSNSFTIGLFIFCLTFAAMITITNNNFGTLARYKMPCMPFIYFILFYIYRLPDSKIKKID